MSARADGAGPQARGAVFFPPVFARCLAPSAAPPPSPLLAAPAASVPRRPAFIVAAFKNAARGPGNRQDGALIETCFPC